MPNLSKNRNIWTSKVQGYLWIRVLIPVWFPLIESICNIHGTLGDLSKSSSEIQLNNEWRGDSKKKVANSKKERTL